MEADADEPSQLRSMPCFSYVEAYKDAAGTVMKDVIVGYILSKAQTNCMLGKMVSPFDNGRKFFAISFPDKLTLIPFIPSNTLMV